MSSPVQIPPDAMRRLNAYRPFSAGGVELKDVLGDLLSAAAIINDGKLPNLVECQTALKDLWRVDFELDELRAVRKTLVDHGDAESGCPGVKLTPSAIERLSATQDASDANEAAALREWAEAVRDDHPDLTDDDLRCLEDDLATWLNHLVVRHGAEAALVLYPEDQRAHDLFAKIDEIDRSIFPADRSAAACDARNSALKRFIRQPTPDQRSYLASRLNTAFYLTVLTLDPAATKLVQAESRDTRLYCDTNFLYALLGVGTADEAHAANRLVQLTQHLGCKLVVTPWTVEELHTSIKRARREGVDGFAPRAGMATILAEVTRGAGGVAHAFWQTHAENGISAADFFARINNFEIVLRDSFSIVVDDTSTARINRREEDIRDYSYALQRIAETKSDAIADHDAKHRLLIEQLRGSGTIRFSNARYWFLTQDTSLAPYARTMPDPTDPAPELPFCISPTAWMQVARALTPRTEDYEAMVVELLTAPFVGRTPIPDVRAIREVVARIDQHEDASPELAVAVLKDTALVEDITQARPEEIEERVTAAFSTKMAETQARAADAVAVARHEREAREAAEAAEVQVRRDLDDERARSAGARSDMQRERDARAEQASTHEHEIAEIKDQLAATARDFDDYRQAERDKQHDAAQRRSRCRRAVGGGAIALLAAAATVVLLVWKTAPLGYLLAVTIGGSLAVSGGLRLALPDAWNDEIRWLISLAAIPAGIVLAIVLSK